MPPRPELTPRRGRRPSALISSIQLIPQLFDKLNPEPSSLKLLYALLPDWQREEGPIEFVRFTDGITNTVSGAD